MNDHELPIELFGSIFSPSGISLYLFSFVTLHASFNYQEICNCFGEIYDLSY